MPNELTKALLIEEVVAPAAIADALFASLERKMPLVLALLETDALTPDVLERYLARSEAPVQKLVVPVAELVDRLPEGLCARLFAVPVRRDAITGTIDVVVADPSDPHPAEEIGFHLNAPVRMVRAPVRVLEEALRRLRSRASEAHDADKLYDSRPRAGGVVPRFQATLPPPDPRLDGRALTDSAAPSQGHPPIHHTPPWGTPSARDAHDPISDAPPRSGAFGSEIPIPLTRRAPGVSGGTQRPPPLVDPTRIGLGEGYAAPPGSLRPVLEIQSMAPEEEMPTTTTIVAPPPLPSYIPGAPPSEPQGVYPPGGPLAPVHVLSALRTANSRDEILELVLTAAREVARKVAIFVVKRDGYQGWACTPEFGDRAALPLILIPLSENSVFSHALRDGLYLGNVPHDAAHAVLAAVMRTASRDVAVIPVRVAGRPIVMIVADELADTMIGTRRLDEIARAAGDAFGRIVRTRSK